MCARRDDRIRGLWLCAWLFIHVVMWLRGYVAMGTESSFLAQLISNRVRKELSVLAEDTV